MLSIGSNVGDRQANLRLALDVLRPWLQAVSAVYETPPWGPVPQADYLNAVLLVSDGAADAVEWLTRAHAAERSAHRERDVRWGPRTLDVDVVTVRTAGGDVRSDDPQLTLPHPRAHERAFVLVPWLAVDSSAVLRGVPLGDLIALLPADERAAVRRTGVELR